MSSESCDPTERIVQLTLFLYATPWHMDTMLSKARQLRDLFTQRASSDPYILSKSDQNNVSGLHVAVALVEFGILAGRAITRSEEIRYEGNIALARKMDDGGEQGEEIFSLYRHLFKEVKERRYFR